MLPASFTAILKLLYCDTLSNVQDLVVGSDDLFALVVKEKSEVTNNKNNLSILPFI